MTRDAGPLPGRGCLTQRSLLASHGVPGQSSCFWFLLAPWGLTPANSTAHSESQAPPASLGFSLLLVVLNISVIPLG